MGKVAKCGEKAQMYCLLGMRFIKLQIVMHIIVFEIAIDTLMPYPLCCQTSVTM